MITLGVPSAGHPKIEFVNSLMQLVSSGLISECLIMPRLPVQQARTQIARNLQTDYLLFIDDDMVFTPEDVQKLIRADKDIVSGLCLKRTDKERQPVVYAQESDRYVLRDAPNELEQVDATTLAFTLIKSKVFQHISTEFRFTDVGEDLDFMRRASDKGFKIWVEPEARIGHVMETTLI